MEFFIHLNLIFFLFIFFKFKKLFGEGLFVSPIFIYLVFHSISFILKPYLIYYADFNFGYQYMEFKLESASFNFTIFISMLALFFLYLGSYFGFKGEKINHNFLRNINFKTFIPHKYDYHALIILLLFIAPFGIHSIINIEALHQATNQYNTYAVRVFEQSSGYYFFSNIAFGSLLLLFFFLKRFSILSSIPLMIYLYIRIDYGWSRFSFILVFVTLGLLFLIYNIEKKNIFFLSNLGIAGLFQYIGRTRAISGGGFSNYDNLDIANFESLSFIIKTVPEMTKTYSYFTQYLQLFTEPIPRALWKSKPVGSPVQFFNLNDYGNFNVLTNSLIGDGWISFGYFGIIVMMTITGYFCTKLFISLTKNYKDAVFVFLYTIQLPVLIMWFRDGGIGFLKIFLFYSLPILLWYRMRKTI
jgi:hypothetical protein